MLFTDYLFFPFMAACVGLNVLFGRNHLAHRLFILLVSWLFFSLWGLADLGIFVAALTANYLLVSRLASAETDSRRAFLLHTIVSLDLVMLAVFKYKKFILEDALGLLAPGQTQALLWSNAWAPLAISFYTFHMISYAIDIYSRKYPFTTFLNYTTYISFFPHLIAGPIVRGNQLVPQFAERWTPHRIDWSGGVYLFTLGFFLKAIGDQLSTVVDPYFLMPDTSGVSWTGHWLVAFLFSCHIFSDFAGYSFMAMGAAKLLGYELPLNFDAPYLAGTFRTFWHRWHITLSSFLRDYLYVLALGGNRKGRLWSLLNLVITMLLGGLWHGAAWTFVIWGGIHGAALMVERLLGIDRRTHRRWPAVLGWYLVVQVTVVIAWVFFRSTSLRFASAFLSEMFSPGLGIRPEPTLLFALVLTLPVIAHHLARGSEMSERLMVLQPARGVLAGAMFVLGLVLLGRPAAFVYFNF